MAEQLTLKRPIAALGNRIIGAVSDVGSFFLFLREIAQVAVKAPFRAALILQQLEFIGNQSLNIILMTAFFTGAVFGLQIGGVFAIFRAEGMMGAATGKALARELAPMMTAFLLTGRAGSAMTAEIATMKVNEQVDAMEAMGVDPLSYLVVPRVIASMLVLPFLCGVFVFVGVLGAYIMGSLLFNVDRGVFVDKIIWLVKPIDLVSGLEKSVAFAIVIAALACRYGLRASGGAKGVGVATTTAVVVTLLTLLGFDFFLTYFQTVTR